MEISKKKIIIFEKMETMSIFRQKYELLTENITDYTNEINTIIENMEKTGELENCNQLKLIEEIEILINQFDLEDEYNLSNDINIHRYNKEDKNINTNKDLLDKYIVNQEILISII